MEHFGGGEPFHNVNKVTKVIKLGNLCKTPCSITSDNSKGLINTVIIVLL